IVPWMVPRVAPSDGVRRGSAAERALEALDDRRRRGTRFGEQRVGRPLDVLEGPFRSRREAPERARYLAPLRLEAGELRLRLLPQRADAGPGVRLDLPLGAPQPLLDLGHRLPEVLHARFDLGIRGLHFGWHTSRRLRSARHRRLLAVPLAGFAEKRSSS